MHTHFSPDSETDPDKLVKRCLKVGLELIAVTDHNTIEGALKVKDSAPFPVIIGEDGVEKIIELDLNSEEKKNFDKSIQAVKDLFDAAKKIDSSL